MFASIKPYLVYVEVLALIVLIVCSYTFGHHNASVADGRAQAIAVTKQQTADIAELNRQVKQTQDNAASAQALAVKAATEHQKTKIVYQTITKQAVQYVQSHPDNSVCTLDDDGLSIWRAANAGSNQPPSAGKH